MKKILTIFAVVMFLIPNLSFAQTNEETINALRAEIRRLTALLETGAVNTSVSVVARPASCLDLPSMRQGARGDDVKQVQEFLISRTESKWPSGISATGYFGTVTTNSLAEFQVANSIVLTKTSLGAGLYGPKTKAFVQTLTCSVVPEVEAPVLPTLPEPQTPVEVPEAPVVRASGMYVSLIPQSSGYPVFEAGDLGQILGLRFEAVGMDLNLKRIGLDFTEGDVIGVELLNVQTVNTGVTGQTIVASTNLDSKEFFVNLEREFIIPRGEYKDLQFVVKVGNTTSLSNDFYQLNIDTVNSVNTYALDMETGNKIYISNLQKFDNQGAWLLDNKTEASIYISSPVLSANYASGETVQVRWSSSTFLEEEKVRVDILDRSGILGVSVLPSFEVVNTGSLDWTLPAGFSTQTGTFAIRLSCTIHECEATTPSLSLKSN